MDAEHRVITVDRHEWVLKQPAHHTEGTTMQPVFTRGFKLHHNGQVLDGAEFPSGHVALADDPEFGFGTGAASLEELLKGYHGARVEWQPPVDRAVEIEQLRAEVERLHAGEEPGSTPHGNLTDGQWLRHFNEAGAAQRLAIINCLRWEAARGADCFLMAHAGRLERLSEGYTRERKRAEAMERAMESTAADALKHRGCHRDLMAQCLRAERAEAEAERLRTELRRLADEAQPTTEPEPGCTHCGKTIRRITGTLTEWWVHIPGGQALCYPWQPARSTRATPKAAAGARQDGVQQ